MKKNEISFYKTVFESLFYETTYYNFVLWKNIFETLVL
jgi:hypothetical protein